jgi:hypothetical protein
MTSPRIGGSERYLRSWRGPAAVTLVVAAALIYDGRTPQVVSTGVALTANQVTLVFCIQAGKWLTR